MGKKNRAKRTKAVFIRLSEREHAILEEIQSFYGINTAAETIRLAIATTHNNLPKNTTHGGTPPPP